MSNIWNEIINNLKIIVTWGPLLWLSLNIMDKFLDYVFHFVFFEYIWIKLKFFYKIFRTFYDPIKSEFIFSITFHEKIIKENFKEIMYNLINIKLREYKNDINISDVSYWDDKSSYRFSILYYGFKIDVIFKEKLDIINKNEIEGLTISLNSNYNFGKFNEYINTINSLLKILENGIEDTFKSSSIGSGSLQIEPLKHNLNVEDWIKKGKFDMNTILKNKDENIIIEIQPQTAKIIVPYRILNPKIIKYYREIIVHYYL